MDKIFLVMSSYGNDEGHWSTPVKAFEDQTEAELYAIYLEEEHIQLSKEYKELRKEYAYSLTDKDFREKAQLFHSVLDKFMDDHKDFDIGWNEQNCGFSVEEIEFKPIN